MQRPSQQLRAAVNRPEETAMHCQTFSSTVLTANASTCREIVNEVKKIIKDKREPPTNKVNALKVRPTQIFHACMMAGNPQFLSYVCRKIMSRLSIMAKHKYNVADDNRGLDLFGSRDSVGQAASAEFLRNLLSYIRIWAENFGKGSTGPTEFHSVYTSVVNSGAKFPSAEHRSSLASPVQSSRSPEKPKVVRHVEAPHKFEMEGVNQEEVRQTMGLLKELMRSRRPDQEVMSELVVKLQGLKSLVETEIQLKAANGLIGNDLEKLFSLNDQAQKILEDYLTMNADDAIVEDEVPVRQSLPNIKKAQASADIMNLRLDDSPPPIKKKQDQPEIPQPAGLSWAANPMGNPALNPGANPVVNPGMNPAMNPAFNPAMFASMSGMPMDWQSQFMTMQAAMMMQQSMMQPGGPSPAAFQTMQPQTFSLPGSTTQSQQFGSQAFALQPRASLPSMGMPVQAPDQSQQLKAQMAALTKEEAVLHQEVDSLTSSLEALEASHKQCIGQLTDSSQLMTQLSELTLILEKLTNELELMKQRGRNATTKVIGIQKKAQESLANVNRLAAEVQICDQEVTSLETRMKQKEADIKQRKTQVDSVKADTVRVEAEYNRTVQECTKVQQSIMAWEEEQKRSRQQEIMSRMTIDTSHAVPAKAASQEHFKQAEYEGSRSPKVPEAYVKAPMVHAGDNYWTEAAYAKSPTGQDSDPFTLDAVPAKPPVINGSSPFNVDAKSPIGFGSDPLKIEVAAPNPPVKSQSVSHNDPFRLVSSSEDSSSDASPTSKMKLGDPFDPFDIEHWK
jgi:hypothetical protein